MSFLAPLYLLLGLSAAVPLVIHLMRRRIGARVEFPAARYLARAEREHSRTLRIRNLLLMFLRVLALLAIAVAAARPVARWVGSGHAPTALAIVIDNSLSSSAVVNGRPLLDQFKGAVRGILSSSTSADRLWLVTVDGKVNGGSAGLLRDAVDRLEPVAGAGDLPAALSRVSALVRGSGLNARQVAVVTDGQRSEWESVPPLSDIQIVVYVPEAARPVNHAVTLAEARPARWTPRGAVVARFQTRDSVTYRMTLGGRTFARGTAAPGEEATVRAAPPERGWTAGTVELEPDELPGDNVRHFAAWIGPAPGVSVSASAGPFVKNAIDVLRESEMVQPGRDVAVVSADDLVSLPALITAPTDPVRLGAANRALERAGVPWRFGARRAGESSVRGAGFDSAGVTVRERYVLTAQPGAVAETLSVVGREPWMVAGPQYVLVGSPLVAEATSLPIRAAFVPWLGGVLAERLAGGPGQVIAAEPGQTIPRPRWAESLEAPEGGRTPLSDRVEVPARPGTYFLIRGGRRVGAIVANPAPGESVLDHYSTRELADRLHGERTLAAPTASAWSAMAFRAAARRSLLEPALVAALFLIIGEAIAVGARKPRVA